MDLHNYTGLPISGTFKFASVLAACVIIGFSDIINSCHATLLYQECW